MTSYFNKFLRDLRTGISPNKNMFISMGIDFAFLIITVLLLFLWMQYIMTQAMSLQGIDYTALMNIDRTSVFEIEDLLFNFIISFVFSFIILWLLFLLFYSLAQAFIWQQYSKKRLNYKAILKAIFINFVIFTPGIILLLFLIIKYQGELMWLYAILFIVLMHFSGILNLHFAYHHKMRRAFYKAFEHGILKVHHFILPYLLIVLILFFVRFIISSIFPNLYYLFFGVFILVYISLVRNYFITICKREVKDA